MGVAGRPCILHPGGWVGGCILHPGGRSGGWARLSEFSFLTGGRAAAKLATMTTDDSVRLDVWLDAACIFKTRSHAQTACKRGRVEVNGDHGKPHRAIRPGDTIRIKIPGGRRRIIEVLELESVNVSRARARELYADHTPPPTAEEIELRKMQRLSAPPKRIQGSGAPKKRERREVRKIKVEWE